MTRIASSAFLVDNFLISCLSLSSLSVATPNRVLNYWIIETSAADHSPSEVCLSSNWFKNYALSWAETIFLTGAGIDLPLIDWGAKLDDIGMGDGWAGGAIAIIAGGDSEGDYILLRVSDESAINSYLILDILSSSLLSDSILKLSLSNMLLT